ncbi:MAG: hypothetical protein A2138_08300 [Deltaproteobacteria bacterium RBG_16_71_12]|nr:MAG: hypothetical protein A2138_08300 [Deltaproteobacteria bacterium RBG_16_71_12]
MVARIERARIRDDGALDPFELSAVSQREPRRGHQAAVVQGSVVLVGGSDGANNLNTTEIIAFDDDGELSASGPGPSLLARRRGPRAAVIDDVLLVIGGRGTAGADFTHDASTLAGGIVYAFGAGGTSLAEGRGFYTSAVAADALYVFGGNEIDVVEGALAANGWPGVFFDAGSLATPRENHQAAFAGGKVWLLGGFDGDGQVTAVEAAPVTELGLGTFATVPGVAPPTAMRTGGCAVRLRDFVHLIAGAGSGSSAITAFSARLSD